MAQVLVRNLEDRVVATLKRRAEVKGRSLEQELREILSMAATPTTEDRIAQMERIASMTPRDLQRRSDSLKLLREDRDR